MIWVRKVRISLQGYHLKNRLFRACVCFLVILCLICNIASLPAKAIAIADDIAIGLFALLVLAAAGVVLVPQASSEIVDIGNSFKTSMYNWGTSAGTYDDVVVWIDLFSNLQYDPDDSPNETKVKLARGILAGITAWIASTIIAGKIESEGAVAPDGYAYYNGVLLPELPSVDFTKYPYCYITRGNPGTDYANTFYCTISSYRATFGHKNGVFPNYLLTEYNCNGYKYVCHSGDTSWKPRFQNAFTTISGICDYSSDPYFLMWSNVDVLAGSDGSLRFSGTEPSKTQTTTYVPTTYVGDLPQQIQNGEKDEKDIVLPEAIDFSKLLQDGKTLEQSVTDTLTQLSDGTLTHADYLTQIEAAPETLPDTGTSTDTWTPPSDPGAFALDLTSFFPFCIPFDLYDFLTCLNADPVAPVINWDLSLPGIGTYPITIDLSPFDSVAQLLRRLQLLLFIIGLAVKTRDLIKG